MTDMDKMMIEEVARAISTVENADQSEYGWQSRVEAAEAAMSAYNPDDRLREALNNERGAKQLYKDFENTTDEHVELVFSANACPEHKALADEMREWFRAAVDAALSPLPQGDG